MAVTPRPSITPVPTAVVQQTHDHVVPPRQFPDYLEALKRRWWIVVCSMVVATGAALALVHFQAEQYKAAATLMLDSSRPVEVVLQAPASRSLDPERDVNTSVALVRTERLATAVKRQLGLTLTVEEILREVHARMRGNSNVLEIAAQDASARRAADIANAFARQYVHFRRASSRTAYLQAIQLAQRRLAALGPLERRQSVGRSLRARLTQLQIAATLQTGGVQPIDAAAVPAHVSSAPTKQVAGVGAVLGLMIGAALALILEFRDRRVKEESDVRDATALEVMGRVPVRRPLQRLGAVGHRLRKLDPSDDTVRKEHDDERDAGWSPSTSPQESEAFAALAANVRYLGFGSGAQTIMVASAGAGDGKTSVTLGLGAALARVGLRVVAIEADLRRPAFSRYLAIPGRQKGAQGIVGLLIGSTSLEKELVELDPVTGLLVNGRPIDRGYFAIVPAGPSVPDPHRLFSSPRMPAVLAAVRERADVILVDTPALTAASDAVSLREYVDAALFVVRLNESRSDEVTRSIAELRNVGVDVVGTVVVGATPKRVPAYDGAPGDLIESV
jgi:Mrp family chromosome partitioning ATPase/capsular polysaccharide biosynthesis protein